MAADVDDTLAEWSTTAGSNKPTGATAISTNLDDNLREIQAVVRTLAAADTIASATTTDLSTKNNTFITVTGTTTITGLGTVSAGIYKWIIFDGVLTFTHNSTSLILPTGASLTTAAGDTALMLSLGSGNWRCLAYLKKSGEPVGISTRLSAIGAANAANTIANGDSAQTWNWELITAGKSGFKIGETAASTGTDAILLDILNKSTSTAWPLRVRVNDTIEVLTIEEDGKITIGNAAEMPAASQEIIIQGYYGDGSSADGGIVRVYGGGTSSNGNGGDIFIYAGDSAGNGTGGDIELEAGDSASGTPGNISLLAGQPDGSGTAATGGNVTITGGSANGSSGNAAGGTVTIRGGAGYGSGADGIVSIGYCLKVKDGAAGSSQHVVFEDNGVPPTINTGGGTGATIAGADNAFRVTMGTGSPTSVTVDFGTAWATAPVVVCSTSKTSAMLAVTSATTTQVVIATSSAWAQNDILHVMCFGYQ